MSMTFLACPGPVLVEDMGRPGYAHVGVPRAGALDSVSLATANWLVGNLPDAAAVEFHLAGPTVRFEQDQLLAVAADALITLDGRPVPAWHTIAVRAGQILTVGPLRDTRCGYLAVRGGFDAAQTLGSRSTCTLSGLGPIPLVPGDTLDACPPSGGQVFRSARPAVTPGHALVRVVPGPELALFPAAAWELFITGGWTVSAASNRVGIRLDGRPVPAPSGSMLSTGVVTGAVQVPPSGYPVVLGPDHGTTGGYPVLAVVVNADLPLLAQVRPGRSVRFQPVSAPGYGFVPEPKAGRRYEFSAGVAAC